MAKKGTLKYRKVSRTPQVGKDAGKKKFYATAVQDRTMEFEDFVTHISEHNSPYSRGTVHGVLMDTLDCLQELILDGKSVRFADLGLFSIGMTSRGEDNAEKVNASSITGVHLIVRNTKNWSNTELRKMCKITALGSEVTEEGDGGDTPSGDNGGKPSGDNGGSTPSGDNGGSTPSGGSSTTGGDSSTTGGGNKGDNTGQGGGSSSGSESDNVKEY
uniref:HU family DNA-binding protein n=1 Tax=Prevotella sp. TaxID=59823 RepID=UPI004025445E